MLQGCWRSRSDFQFCSLRSGERTSSRLDNFVLDVDVPDLVLDPKVNSRKDCSALLYCPTFHPTVDPLAQLRWSLPRPNHTPRHIHPQYSYASYRAGPWIRCPGIDAGLPDVNCLGVGRNEVERSICYEDMRMTCRLFLVWLRRQDALGCRFLMLTQQRRECDEVKEAWTQLPRQC